MAVTPTRDLVRDCGRQRRLPVWGWLLAVVTWPAGVFVALAGARVIRWWQAVIWAIGSYAIVIALSVVMSEMENLSDQRVCSVALVVCFALLIVLGAVQYRIGKRHAYWSDQAKRIWRIIGVTVLIFFAVDALAMIVRFVIPSLPKR